MRVILYWGMNESKRQMMPEEPLHHPALERFSVSDDGTARLLLVRAATGTGRRWFADSWMGEHDGEIHDWSASGLDEVSKLQPLLERMREEPQLRVAIILAPSASTWAMSAFIPTVVAEHRDLLLTLEEIFQLEKGKAQQQERLASRIYTLCGGWLGAVRILIEDPGNLSAAQNVIRNGLAVWLQQQDSRGTLAEAGYLAKFDAPTVEAFYGEYSQVGHTLADLVDSGLVLADGHGGWMMSILVRRVLTERAGALGHERVGILEQAAVNALVVTHGIVVAADSAVDRRRWPALLNMLMANWVDLFLTDPRRLAIIASKVPPFITDQTEYLRWGTQILTTLGDGDRILRLPSIEPRYATDQLAQSLRQETERHQRKPTVRALTIGLLEVVHLRLSGMYEEAGMSAVRLRKTLNSARSTQRSHLALSAIIELQAGISLQMTGHNVEALRAYEMALDHATASGKAFLIADASGKLALLNAVLENVNESKHHLRKHHEVIENVAWGRNMIGRAASLASAWLAVLDADFASVHHVLSQLPSIPDNDEFWSVHTHLLSIMKIQEGVPEAAKSLVLSMRGLRRYAAAAPLARVMLDDALLMIGFVGRQAVPPEMEGGQGNQLLLALWHLRCGQPDEALGILQNRSDTSNVRGRDNFAVYLELAARNSKGATLQMIQQVINLHRDSGNLIQLALLLLIPGWDELAHHPELTSDELQRLGVLRAIAGPPLAKVPPLSSREQEILSQLRAGMNRGQIAKAGFRSENTVKTQMRSLYRKLGASNLRQVLENARANGL